MATNDDVIEGKVLIALENVYVVSLSPSATS
jgi:hypothetical protein